MSLDNLNILNNNRCLELKLTDKKRLDIIDAAITEFMEFGFMAVKMSDVAKRAEVSKRTLYNHFESKEALFHEIILLVKEKTDSAFNCSYDKEKDIREQLIQIAIRFMTITSSSEYIALARVALSEYIRSPKLIEEAISKDEQMEGRLVTFIKNAMDDKKLIEKDPEYACKQLTSLLKAFSFWRPIFKNIYFRDEEELKEVAIDNVDLFLAKYRN